MNYYYVSDFDFSYFSSTRSVVIFTTSLFSPHFAPKSSGLPTCVMLKDKENGRPRASYDVPSTTVRYCSGNRHSETSGL